jgi:hypothetical protein
MALFEQFVLILGTVLVFCAAVGALHARNKSRLGLWGAVGAALLLGLVRLKEALSLYAQSPVAAIAYSLFYVVGAGLPVIVSALWLSKESTTEGFRSSFRTATIVALSVLPFSVVAAYVLLFVVVHFTCVGNNCL